MNKGESLPIVCAMRVCARNEAAFIAALEASFAFDGQLNATLWAGVDREHCGKLDAFRKAAEKAFATVHVVQKGAPTADAWPIPQNQVWQQAARWLDSHCEMLPGKTHWLWWESDACPVRVGWLATLSKAIATIAAPFGGVRCLAPDGTTYMNGVGLWPIRSLDLLADTAAFYCRETPFDIAARYGVMRQFADLGHLILHLHKQAGGNPPLALTPKELSALLEKHPKAVFIHGIKPISLPPIISPPTITTKQKRQKQQMNETSKAMRRRACEQAEGSFPWNDIFTGAGVDVGAGADPVQLPNCKPFDMGDGDANHLSRKFKAGSLDYVHASQCLEHMLDPRAALLDWAICLKPEGHLVVTVPSWELYENCTWPSRFNPDHKSAWSYARRKDPRCPALVFVPDFVRYAEAHGLKCLLSRLVDTNYDYSLAPEIDQTWPEDGAECFIELVFRKERK